MPFPQSIQNPTSEQFGRRVQGSWPRMVLLTTTGASTWTVPEGVSKVRAYAFGPGGSAAAATTKPGGGGGCAFGEIDVSAGQVVQTFIAAGDSQGDTRFGPWLIGRGATTDGTNNRIGGTAWVAASVQNGGAFSGASGLNTGGFFGGSSSGSPLGNGFTGGVGGTSGGGGWGGIGGDGSSNHGGGGGGVGGAGEGASSGMPGRGASSGASFRAAIPGLYTDPLLALCNGVAAPVPFNAPAAAFTVAQSGNGCGGSGLFQPTASGIGTAGSGGIGGGGGSAVLNTGTTIPINGGAGGLGGGGGGSYNNSSSGSGAGGAGGFGGGGGVGYRGGDFSFGPGAGGQGCIIIFY